MSQRVLLQRLFAHNAWANREAAAAVRKAGAPAAVLRLLNHVAGAERLWRARIAGIPSPLAVWPALDLEGCTAEFAALAREWDSVLADADDAALARPVAYVNSLGESWRSTLGDILAHVPLHSSYHRGQVATALRAAGAEPAYTDFIHATRTGRI